MGFMYVPYLFHSALGIGRFLSSKVADIARIGGACKYSSTDFGVYTSTRFWLRFQPVDATNALNLEKIECPYTWHIGDLARMPPGRAV
jgi:hypothetical protein